MEAVNTRTIDEIMDATARANMEIKTILSRLEDETGLSIGAIFLDKEYTSAQMRLTGVRVNVQIP